MNKVPAHEKKFRQTRGGGLWHRGTLCQRPENNFAQVGCWLRRRARGLGGDECFKTRITSEILPLRV